MQRAYQIRFLRYEMNTASFLHKPKQDCHTEIFAISTGINYEIIQRQMGHLLGDKVRKAYDNSLMLKERKKYLEEWGNLLVQTGLRI